MTAPTLGAGGSGPWEDRTLVVREQHPNPLCVAAHLNLEHSVQRFRFPDYPGTDLLTVKRHDDGDQHPGWRALQAIKCALTPDGTERWGFELFPPTGNVVNNQDIWHIWVMSWGWAPPIGLHLPGVRV